MDVGTPSGGVDHVANFVFWTLRLSDECNLINYLTIIVISDQLNLNRTVTDSLLFRVYLEMRSCVYARPCPGPAAKNWPVRTPSARRAVAGRRAALATATALAGGDGGELQTLTDVQTTETSGG